MRVNEEKQRQKLEDVAEHIRAMYPDHTWKVFTREHQGRNVSFLRGVQGTQEPEEIDTHCFDLFSNGNIVVCEFTPELVGRISMRGKPEKVAQRFFEMLANVFDEAADSCQCPNCQEQARAKIKGNEKWLLLQTLGSLSEQERTLWVDFSAGQLVH